MICKIHVKLSYPFADFRMNFSGGGFHNSNYAATIDTGIPQQDSAYQKRIQPNPSKSIQIPKLVCKSLSRLLPETFSWSIQMLLQTQLVSSLILNRLTSRNEQTFKHLNHPLEADSWIYNQHRTAIKKKQVP